jgi:hypothetical protein
MAIGDSAAAAGFPLVSSTDQVKDGHDHHNETRDILARKVHVGATAPVSPAVGDLWFEPI